MLSHFNLFTPQYRMRCYCPPVLPCSQPSILLRATRCHYFQLATENAVIALSSHRQTCQGRTNATVRARTLYTPPALSC